MGEIELPELKLVGPFPVIVPPGMGEEIEESEEVEEDEIEQMMTHLKKSRHNLQQARRVTGCNSCVEKIRDVEGDLQELVDQMDKSVEAYRKLEDMDRDEFKEKIRGKLKEGGGYTGQTFSDEGQTDEEYCLECCVSHVSEAYAMLDEAERLSDGERINDESVDRVWRAVKCIKEMKPDLEKSPPQWGDDLKRRVRRIRKQNLLRVVKTREMDDLQTAKDEVESLWKRTRELYEKRGG